MLEVKLLYPEDLQAFRIKYRVMVFGDLSVSDASIQPRIIIV